MDNDRRKQLLEQYKQRTVVGGIYRIRNTANERFFMDWDDDIAGAEKSFAFTVQTGFNRPDLPAMKADWSEYGAESFVFEKLEELEKGETQTREEFFDDLRTLLELWKEKTDMSLAYKK